MDAIDLKVVGMSCQHCVDAVTKALEAVAGVEKVEVNLEGKSARVWGQAAKAVLEAAVKRAGFNAS